MLSTFELQLVEAGHTPMVEATTAYERVLRCLCLLVGL